MAEDVESEEYVDDGVARDDPFVATGKHGRRFGIGVDNEFEPLDSRGAAANNENTLPCRRFAVETRRVVDFSFKGFLVLDMGHFWITTRAYRGNDAVEATIGRVIDYPAALFVLIHFRDRGVKLGAFLQTVAFPEFGDLRNDLLAVGVALAPLNRWVEAIHD